MAHCHNNDRGWPNIWLKIKRSAHCLGQLRFFWVHLEWDLHSLQVWHHLFHLGSHAQFLRAVEAGFHLLFTPRRLAALGSTFASNITKTKHQLNINQTSTKHQPNINQTSTKHQPVINQSQPNINQSQPVICNHLIPSGCQASVEEKGHGLRGLLQRSMSKARESLRQKPTHTGVGLLHHSHP